MSEKSSKLNVSTQDKYKIGGASQKKWEMVLDPQNGKLSIHVLCIVPIGNPETHTAVTSSTHSLLFIMTVYLRGLHMATKRSYAMTIKM